MKFSIVGVVGAGSMGSGIAQVAATAGHKTLLFDSNGEVLKRAKKNHQDIFKKLQEKGKLTSDDVNRISGNLTYCSSLSDLKGSSLVIEAIVENLSVKQTLFADLEKIVSADSVLASNTSSLSITSIASSCKDPGRVVGVHFFNPAPLMPLVEIVAGNSTKSGLPGLLKELLLSWKKVPVLTGDTPGFIVNRVARPFYGEALRIYEEGIADFATIDEAMRRIGFRMGPFELMDLIGNDINYEVTRTVWEQFFFDPRYKPSFTQRSMVASGRLGKKTGKGYYDYSEAIPSPSKDENLLKGISDRILCMLINEAADALYLKVASAEDIDLAMTKGVNYPKGLLKWADELGSQVVLSRLESLYNTYCEDRYRPSLLLRKKAEANATFF